MTFRRTRCKHCKQRLEPGQRLLHPGCIDEFAVEEAARIERKKAKEVLAAAKVERAETKRRKEAAKSINKLTKEAQKEFNAYIRVRDERQPCISCGQALDSGGVGGGFDCGHYRSTGAAKHLRFHPDNAHGQCKHCNRWLSGRVADYRIGLLGRIGEKRLLQLEASNEVHKWTKDELRAIKAEYRAKTKELKGRA